MKNSDGAIGVGILRKTADGYIFHHGDGLSAVLMGDEELTIGAPLTPYGEAEAARMTPETEIAYLRQQLSHRERQCEEVQAVLEQRGRELSDAYAAVRVLTKILRDPSLWGM